MPLDLFIRSDCFCMPFRFDNGIPRWNTGSRTFLRGDFSMGVPQLQLERSLFAVEVFR